MLVYHRRVRVAQLLSPLATAFDAKCRRVDAQSLPEVTEDQEGADLLHIYGPPPRPGALRGITIPYIAESAPSRSKLPWRAVPPPALIAPRDQIPEAVEERYRHSSLVARDNGVRRIGSLVASRPGVSNMVEQTLARIHRFRDDIEWHRFDEPPSPEELAGLDLWVDPLTREDDLDGFVAEAIVSRCLTVAGRTSMNARRSDDGKAAFLVPLRDPNELAHAIVSALFKPEASEARREAMAAAAGRFDPRVRARALSAIYERALGR